MQQRLRPLPRPSKMAHSRHNSYAVTLPIAVNFMLRRCRRHVNRDQGASDAACSAYSVLSASVSSIPEVCFKAALRRQTCSAESNQNF